MRDHRLVGARRQTGSQAATFRAARDHVEPGAGVTTARDGPGDSPAPHVEDRRNPWR